MFSLTCTVQILQTRLSVDIFSSQSTHARSTTVESSSISLTPGTMVRHVVCLEARSRIRETCHVGIAEANKHAQRETFLRPDLMYKSISFWPLSMRRYLYHRLHNVLLSLCCLCVIQSNQFYLFHIVCLAKLQVNEVSTVKEITLALFIDEECN